MSVLWALSLLAAFCAGLLTDALLTLRYQRRRHGGYVKPRASSGVSPRTGGRSRTRRTPAGSSSPLAPGHLSAVAAVRLMPPPASSVGGPGWSIRVPDGGDGIGRTPPVPAATADPITGNTCGCPTDRPCDCPPAVRAFMEPPGAGLLRRNRGDDAA